MTDVIKTSEHVAKAIADLEDVQRMFGLQMVAESDPRANDGVTHASPSHMVGYASAAIREALAQLRKVNP